MLPPIRNARPPNIFFSVTPDSAATSSRIRFARSSSYAIALLADEPPEEEQADDRDDKGHERNAEADHADDRKHEADGGDHPGAATHHHELIAALLLVAPRQARTATWLERAQTAAAVAPRPASSATRSR